MGVLGFSLGGASAILAAGASPDIEAVAADSSFADLTTTLTRELEDGDHLPAPVAAYGLALYRAMSGSDPADVSPERTIAAIGLRPILLIQGTAEFDRPAVGQRPAPGIRVGRDDGTVARRGRPACRELLRRPRGVSDPGHGILRRGHAVESAMTARRQAAGLELGSDDGVGGWAVGVGGGGVGAGDKRMRAPNAAERRSRPSP